MAEKKVNLTSILVTREIQEFLTEYPLDSLYRIIFSTPYFQKRLINKILDELPQKCIIMTDVQTLTSQKNSLLNFWEEKLDLKNEVQRIMPELLIETYQQLGKELIQQKELLQKQLFSEEKHKTSMLISKMK